MTTLLQQKTIEATPAVSNGQVRGLASEALDIMRLSPALVAYNLGYLALTWALALGAIAIFWEFQNPLAFVLAFLVVASRHQALLNVEHEAGHGKLLPNGTLNELAGRWLAAAPVGSPYEAARARHLAHHRLLATDDDPDHELHAGPDKRTAGGLAKHFIGGLLGGYAGMVLMGPPTKAFAPSRSARLQDLASLVVIQGALFAGLTLAFDWWVYPALWLAPLATVTVFFHLLRSFVEHAITDEETGAHSNRLITIASNPLERGLVSPFNMNYHAEHHLIPSVPAPRLPKLKKRLAAREDTPPVLERSSYGSALMRYLSALRD